MRLWNPNELMIPSLIGSGEGQFGFSYLIISFVANLFSVIVRLGKHPICSEV